MDIDKSTKVNHITSIKSSPRSTYTTIPHQMLKTLLAILYFFSEMEIGGANIFA